jgi:hypothetical protein
MDGVENQRVVWKFGGSKNPGNHSIPAGLPEKNVAIVPSLSREVGNRHHSPRQGQAGIRASP